MKKAEDFRKAFGQATPGFESAAKETIRELRAKETQKKRRTAGEWLRYRRPVLAMAMVLVLFIGFLAVNDTMNLSGHTDQIRTGKAQYTVQPIETALALAAGQEEGDGTKNAAKEEIIRSEINAFFPEITYDELVPLNLSVEKQGIRMNVVSGCVKGDRAYFMCTLKNTDGKYDGSELYGLEWVDVDSAVVRGTGHMYKDRKENEYTYLMMLGVSDRVLAEGGNLRVGYKEIKVEDTVTINLSSELKALGRTVEGVKRPKLKDVGAALPNNLKVLDYSEPLDSRILRDVYLTGIGWINGKLHVQLHNKGQAAVDRNKGQSPAVSTLVSCYHDVKSYDELHESYSPLHWDEDGDGWAEWEEYVFNCQPEDKENLELYASVEVIDHILEDDWTVEIPMDPLRVPEDAAVPDTGLVQKMREDFNQFNLWQFFGNWAQGNVDDMVYGLNLTHKLNGEASKARVKELLKSGTPLNYQINDVRSESGEKVYTCTVELDPGSGENPRCERFEVRINTDVMNERYGIDLNSFDNGQPAEMDPALETVSLSRETYINNYLEYFSPGIREKMLPIGLTCEGNGIRMELISGLLKGGEEYIFYSLEDLEGKYDLGSMDTMDLSESIGKWESYSSSPVYRDKTARKVYFIWNPHYGNQPVDLTDRTVTLRLEYLDILQNCWVNIAELVEQYGKITEGVPAPEGTSEWDVQKGEFVTPEGAMVLDHRNPLDIQVFPNLKITGIGWIDDRLHVQVCEKNMTRASLDFGHMVRSELSWYEAENGGSYTEVIFNIKPDSERIKDIYFCPRIGQERIFGPWRIEFPLSAICPEAETKPARVLSEDDIIRANLDLELPGVSDKLLPVHLVSEKLGLRVEVVSGYVSGTESCFVISVQDPEGKYTDYRTDLSFTSDISDSIRGYGFYNLYTNEAEHKTYYAFIPTIYEPVTAEDRIVRAGIGQFRTEQSESFDLLPLLRQYGKTVEGVEQPDAIRRLEGVDQKWPRDLKFLDYTRPLDLPLFGDVCLSGIGWIDGQLHVQFHNTGRTIYQKGNTVYSNPWSVGISCSAGDPYYSVEFDTDYDDSAEWKEYIFNVKPDATDGLALNTYITVLADILDDGWTVEFPLSTICPETAEQAPQADADDAVWPVEELVEDWNVGLDEREGKLVFDVRANTKVYTQDEIGYALRNDGTAEAMPTSIYPGHREGFIIPEKVNGHVVTAIGEEAFWGYSMTSITLPDTVKSIGGHAFRSCDRLENIRIPEGVTSIDSSVFLDCIRLKDVVIPSSVTAIGKRAFSGCLNLTGITIPSATVSIGDYAFVGCTGLTSVTLPESLNTLGCYALYRCTGLETVEVPGGVSLVGNGAFKNCTGLKTARLQEGVTFLGADAFTGCGALETVELPESLRSVGDRAFTGCVSLKKLVLPEGLESIGRAAFMGCVSLKKLVLPEGLESIGQSAFAGCAGLETLEIPESVTSIGENVFKGCENLTCTVTAGSYAMRYCVNNGITCIVK